MFMQWKCYAMPRPSKIFPLDKSSYLDVSRLYSFAQDDNPLYNLAFITNSWMLMECLKHQLSSLDWGYGYSR